MYHSKNLPRENNNFLELQQTVSTAAREREIMFIRKERGHSGYVCIMRTINLVSCNVIIVGLSSGPMVSLTADGNMAQLRVASDSARASEQKILKVSYTRYNRLGSNRLVFYFIFLESWVFRFWWALRMIVNLFFPPFFSTQTQQFISQTPRLDDE